MKWKSQIDFNLKKIDIPEGNGAYISAKKASVLKGFKFC